MEEYINCEKCYHFIACDGDTDKWNYFGECPHFISVADEDNKQEF